MRYVILHISYDLLFRIIINTKFICAKFKLSNKRLFQTICVILTICVICVCVIMLYYNIM